MIKILIGVKNNMLSHTFVIHCYSVSQTASSSCSQLLKQEVSNRVFLDQIIIRFAADQVDRSMPRSTPSQINTSNRTTHRVSKRAAPPSDAHEPPPPSKEHITAGRKQKRMFAARTSCQVISRRRVMLLSQQPEENRAECTVTGRWKSWYGFNLLL